MGVIKCIIDNLYTTTLVLLFLQSIAFFFGIIVPVYRLIFNMSEDYEPKDRKHDLSLALFWVIIFALQELNQILISLRKYFSSFTNWIDIGYIVTYIVYYRSDIDKNSVQLPLGDGFVFSKMKHNSDLIDESDMKIINLNMVLVTFLFLKLLFFLRLFPVIGLLIKFFADSLLRLLGFFVFFAAVILYYSMMYQLAGLDLKNSDYLDTSSLWAYILFVFRSSIGDTQQPSY